MTPALSQIEANKARKQQLISRRRVVSSQSIRLTR
jgi:hypothetical protein